MTTNPAAEALAATTTRILVDSLLLMEVTRVESTLTEDERIARAWIIEELERRFDVEAAMNAWADDTDASDFGEKSYVQALIAALPVEAMSA